MVRDRCSSRLCLWYDIAAIHQLPEIYDSLSTWYLHLLSSDDMPTASALLGPIESDPEDEMEGESKCKHHTFTLDASCPFTHPTVV